MTLIPMLVFVVTAGIVFGVYAVLVRQPERKAQQRVEARLRDIDVTASNNQSVVLRRIKSPLPAFERQIANTGIGLWLARLIEQSGVRTTPATMLLISLLSALAGGLVVGTLVRFPGAGLGGMALGLALPWIYVLQARKRRLKRFEEQFPEALDLLSRALRAGHAFQTGIGMVADELPSPVGIEFKKTYERQNFGLSLHDALDELIDRVPLMDVRFFTTAVSIQRETGGNLAEILDGLAHVVRERFKLLRQVRVHTAHGRFTGYVLLSMPPALGLLLWRMSPNMMQPLFVTPIGQLMLIVAMALQTVGFFWIRKVIDIEV